MIGRLERRILAGIGILTVLLVLLLIYTNSAADNSVRTINVSVLSPDPGDYFRKGIEKAANDYNVDIRFVSSGLYSPHDIETELANNADAIVLDPYDSDETQAFLTETDVLATIVTVGTQLQYQGIAAHIGVDEQQLADTLLGQISEKGEDRPCVIVYSQSPLKRLEQQANDLQADLQRQGWECSVAQIAQGNRASAPAGPPRNVICIESKILKEACNYAREEDGVFGIGYSNEARQYLEDGTINSLVVYSDYDVGYLSMKAAAMAVNGATVNDSILPLYVVDGGNMYQQPINQVLFPIE